MQSMLPSPAKPSMLVLGAWYLWTGKTVSPELTTGRKGPDPTLRSHGASAPLSTGYPEPSRNLRDRAKSVRYQRAPALLPT